MSRVLISRRNLLAAGGALAAGSALAARHPLTVFGSVPKDTTNITFWTPGGSARWCGSLNTNERNFEKIHPNIKVGAAQCYSGQQDFRTKLLASIAAGNPPDALVWWDTPVSLAVVGALDPLDDYMAHSKTSGKAEWPASALASCQYGGKTYGLPATAGSFAVWYNEDWFAKKGISTDRAKFPKTWDDFRRLSKEFTQWRGGKLVSAGFIPFADLMGGGGNLPATMYVWSALNGGQLYDAVNRKYTIDSDANIAMMEYMLAWFNDEYKGDMSALQRTGNWSGYVDSQNRAPAFQNQKLAMLEQGFWYMGDIYGATPQFKKYGVASYPVGPSGKKTVSGYWPNWLVIPKGASHPDEAFQWLDYLGSTGIKLWFSITPDLPTNKTVPSLLPAVTVQHQGTAFATDVTNFFKHQLDISIPMWNSPVQGFATDQIEKAVSQIMYKQSKPKDALASAQTASQAQLDKVLKTH